MEISAWTLASILCKLLMYGGAAMAVGGILTTLLISSTNKQVSSASTEASAANKEAASPAKGEIPGGIAVIAAILLLALGAAVANFFVQVGNFAGTGLAGMFDRTLGEILWQSQVGTAAAFQVMGFLIALGVVATLSILSGPGNSAVRQSPVQTPPVQTPSLQTTVQQKLRVSVTAAAVVAGLAISYASTLTGHSVDYGLAGGLAILLHTFTVFWWMGSLYPLWRATPVLDQQSLHRAMARFGTIAATFVAVVIGAGSVLLWLMVDSPEDILFTRHGQLLGLKLVLVCAILGLAARHKWQLVPLLQEDGNGRARLRRSIAWEMVIAAIILVLTAVLSTAVSPTHGG